MSLVDYLASKYLTKDESSGKKAKKRKRKEKEQNGNVAIVDDDALGWEGNKADEDEDDRPVTVTSSNTSEFRKSKKQAWTTVISNESAAADAIIASAAAERSHATALDDEAPVIVDSGAGTTITMESGAHAGLQTAAQVTAAMSKKRAAELAEFASVNAEDAGKGKETIYRDASGRIINVAMQRAEARKKMQEEEEKARREKEMNKGVVQIAEAERRREAVEKAKYQPFARTKDDVEMNEELKERSRWNDPAAAFLGSKKEGKSASGFPLYKGPSMPNRYGILPGHRWDGVDRGNGTEAMFFKKRNEKKDRKEMEYAWQMDV